jgi:putative membrane protein
MDSQQAAFSSNDINQWQRISPIAIVYFMVKFVHGLLGNLIYLAPAILIGYKEVLANPHIWLPVAFAVVLLLVLATFLSFYFFQYRLTNDNIEIRSGVFSKKHINLPFTRIQNVKLEQPIYYRPFGFTCLQLDTAGSAKQEAKVVALKVDFAEQVKKQILATYQAKPIISDEAELQSEELTPQADNEMLLNQRSLKDLIIHGVTNNRTWIFLGALAPFFEDIANYVVLFFNDLGIDIEKLLTFADKPWWQIGLYALTLTFICMLVVALFSIAGSIISFYGYTLSKVADRYIRRSGLLTKHEVTMRLARLQMVVRQQDWLDVLLNRINLKFEQSNANMQNIQPGAHNNKIIVPSVKPDECQALIDDVYPQNQMMNISYQGISKHFLIRNIIYILLPVFSILIGFFTMVGKTNVLTFIVPLFFVILLIIFCRWLRWGFAVDDNFIYIRKGIFGVDYYCFPRYKVQQTIFKQSWFLQRKKLATVRFVLASGAQNIPFIPQKIASHLIDDALYEVESSRKSWM